jgi:hypothetical protein
VSAEDLECHAIDYDTAFLNGELVEEVCLEQPELYDDRSGKVLRRNQALCSLKQAQASSLTIVPKKMTKAGFVLFVKYMRQLPRSTSRASSCWVLCYVDDALVAAKKLIIVGMLEMFEGKDNGEVRDFLGLATHHDCGHQVDQSAYASKKVLEAGMEDPVPKRIPLQPNMHKSPPGAVSTGEASERYRRWVDDLLWLANMTLPDLAYTAGYSYLACHLQMPTSTHQLLWDISTAQTVTC